ncbi:MAG: response regulator [Candidatus Omnitrophota bacterium]
MAKKILIVDDEQDILRIITFRLKNLGYELLTAGDGQAALDTIAKSRPDLIILDLRLPIIDGQEVCRRVKGDERTKDIPVILLTASSGLVSGDKVKDLGADDFILKPFDTENLIAKVKAFLK